MSELNYLRSVINSPKRLADPAFSRQLLDAALRSTASWHVLGFIHLKLGDVSDASIRLHIWPVDGTKPAEPNWQVHNHRFDLRSLVLAGSITNETHEVLDAERSDHRLYDIVYHENRSERIATERHVRVTSIRSETVMAGQVYTIPSGVYHASFAPTGTVSATLVETIPSAASPPSVVGTSSGLPRYEYSARAVDGTLLKALLDGLGRSLLAKQS